jgi:hypothetical protein
MIVSIHQPNYLPWLGYFDKIARSDVFVLLDDVQLVRGKSFTIRNRVKTSNGVTWLTVPVVNKSEQKTIKDNLIVQDGKWQKTHWKTIELSYRKSAYFNRYETMFGQVYQSPWENLSKMNTALIKIVKEQMGISTKLVLSSEIGISETGAEKILSILKALKADKYITGEGEGSKRYIREEDFKANGIELVFQRFQHPTYHQLWGDFIPGLSIIDLLFNEGEKSLPILMGEGTP